MYETLSNHGQPSLALNSCCVFAKVLKTSNDRFMKEMSSSSQLLAAKWAESQIRFKDEMDKRIQAINNRLNSALKRQKQVSATYIVDGPSMCSRESTV